MEEGVGRGTFSSPEERSAAASLLLLRSSPVSAPSSASSASRSFDSSRSATATSGSWIPRSDAVDSVEEQCHSSSSTSSSPLPLFSSLTTVSDPAQEVCRELQADPLLMLSMAARCLDPKRKVVRKARTAVIYGSIRRKSANKQKQKEVPDPSCISSASTASPAYCSPTFSGSSSSSKKFLPSPVSATSSVSICRSSGIRKRAEAILDFLCKKGRTSEVKLRAVLGDSPDTSKALRLLVKLDQVKRSGIGGRQSPFLYRVSESPDL